MEDPLESSAAHSQDDKTPLEMNKKRIVKTRAQVEALERSYEEHKYPTEAMKEQLAKSIGLTDKQVSGWFCHRRLKDKRLRNGDANTNGRQDRSSAILQDRGSGLKQDSCGSTKQGDDKNFDLREVESRRLTSQEYSAADFNYEFGSHHTGNPGCLDDTSSGSSSSLRNMSVPSGKDPFNIGNARYQMQGIPVEMKGLKARTGPSGYLKVKNRVENPAITAVKRQLGRHYKEDGPPLGVEFDPLPPGAFESPIQDPQNGVPDSYFAPEPAFRSPDVSIVSKNPMPGHMYGYNSKASFHNSDSDGSRFKTMRGSDQSESHFHQKFEHKSPPFNYGEFYPGKSSSIELHEGSKRGNPVLDVHQRVKHGGGMMNVDSVTGHYRSSSHGVRMNREQAEGGHQNYNGIHLKANPAEHSEYKSSNLTSKGDTSYGFPEKGSSRRMGKETKLFGQRISRNDESDPFHSKGLHKNEVQVAKRARNELALDHFRQTSPTEVPTWTNPSSQVPRSTAEMPSSFSEDDETAETSISAD